MSNTALYSPLSITSLIKPGRDVLLLQFTLAEIFRIYDAKHSDEVFGKPSHMPIFDGCVGYWHKLCEHAFFYPVAFSSSITDSLMTLIYQMNEKNFQINSKKIFTTLEPLIEKYKEDESLIYFFLRYQQILGQILYPITLRDFLIKLHPSGIDKLHKLIYERFEARGFSSIVAQLARLFAYV